MIVTVMTAAYLALAPSGKIPLTDQDRLELRKDLIASIIVTSLLYLTLTPTVRTHL
nr:protein m41.1 [Mastomys natalensis cytomegalovirus 3]WEG69875.1 protein m41.1 [Mastomys natalensis cytomegalovirus 3]WEG70015.1 protein m41.1 [Mastomys natalensis cytomegalovirus 3]WEG70155.1 protein m41.1 [Mastomys natalensis cytomegalovirus 3]WEG70295.1 protein m41.1 [Mastomys natalensis cytomegalovirus 3]